MNRSIIDTAVPCTCGGLPRVSDCSPYGYVIACSACYDGAPDAGRQMITSSPWLNEAVEDWNLLVEEEAMP